MGRGRVLRRAAAAGTVALAALLVAPASPAAAAGERILDYQVTLTLRADASMHVVERIRYDFAGTPQRHGIRRHLPVEFAHDADHTRVYPLTGATASSPTGAPADLDVTYGRTVDLRIGSPDRLVTGVQEYVLGYDLGGVVNTLTDGQELYWNAIGDEWEVPIDHAVVTVSGPAAVTRGACFEGAQASTQPCTRSGVAAGRATFEAAGLGTGQGLTVVTAFPSGTFPTAAPVLEEIWTPQRAFALTPASGGGALALLGLVGGGAALLVARRGRDRRWAGVIPGLTPVGGPGIAGGPAPAETRAPLLRGDPVAVQFTPPKGLRPGQLGTLLDEEANVVDVTATLVDLAVRGYLRIQELPQEGWFRSGDWRLFVVRPAPPDPLEPYELMLMKAVFSMRDEVLLSQLKQTFRADLTTVQAELYEDVTRRGWFRGNPARVRTRWQLAGFALVVAGALLTWGLARSTHLGLVGVGALAGGLVALGLAGRMPARTAAGSALLAQVRGFRLYLQTAEADQIRWEEDHDIFSRYLPYAIVFGVADRWARVFAQLAASGAAVSSPTWYLNSYGYGGPGAFDFGGFGHAMDSFATSTAGALAAATPSSSGSSGFSGGFSGGGGGGGGGGSW